MARPTLTPDTALTEIQLQAKCHQWLWNTYPVTRNLFFHVPNGGSRNAIEGMQLKASGVIAGIPDCLFIPCGKVYGFEFKTHTGRTSPQQDKLHATWAGQGITVYIIRSCAEFYTAIAPLLERYFDITPSPAGLI